MRQFIKTILTLLPIIGFIGAIAIVYFLMDSENEDLRNKINGLNKQIVEQDSTSDNLIKMLNESEELIEKLHNKSVKCPPTYGYTLNGRSLSSNELLDILLTSWEEKDSLSNELNLRIELIKSIEKRWGIQVFQDKGGYGLKLSTDSRVLSDQERLSDLDLILSQLKQRYSLNYELKRVNNSQQFIMPFNMIDSALVLYPYFKDRMKRDKNNFIITKCN